MKTLDIAEATGTLGSYARRVQAGPLLVTRRGRPVMALVAMDEDDAASLRLAADPRFVSLVERSRAESPAGTGVSLEAVRQRLVPKPQAKRRRTTRT